MPVPGYMVAVRDLLLGSELAGDLGVHLRPHRVEARAHRLPHCGHPGPVTLQDRPHRIALPGTEAQLHVQLVHHPVESACPLGRRRGGAADPERPAAGPDGEPRREGGDQEHDGPGGGTIQHDGPSIANCSR